MKPETEDIIIHYTLVASVIGLIGGAVFTALVVAVMIASNFNFMNWLE